MARGTEQRIETARTSRRGAFILVGALAGFFAMAPIAKAGPLDGGDDPFHGDPIAVHALFSTASDSAPAAGDQPVASAPRSRASLFARLFRDPNRDQTLSLEELTMLVAGDAADAVATAAVHDAMRSSASAPAPVSEDEVKPDVKAPGRGLGVAPVPPTPTTPVGPAHVHATSTIVPPLLVSRPAPEAEAFAPDPAVSSLFRPPRSI